MSKQIALTGATGFVGSRVLEALLASGMNVRALCRDPSRLDERRGLTIVAGDLGPECDLEAFVEGCDAVVHIAGLIKARNRKEFDEVNIEGTRRLAAATLAVAPNACFQLMSSLAARAPEISDYAASKRGAEEILMSCGLKDWHILRPPAVYGPGDKATLDLFRQIDRGRCPIPGRGEGRFSLIFVDDLAAAVCGLIDENPMPAVHELHDGQEGGYAWNDLVGVAANVTGRAVKPFRLSYGLMMTLATLVQFWANLLGRTAFISPGKVREFCHEDWVARENLLEEFLAWRPSVRAEEGFATALAWYKAHKWI